MPRPLWWSWGGGRFLTSEAKVSIISEGGGFYNVFTTPLTGA